MGVTGHIGLAFAPADEAAAIAFLLGSEDQQQGFELKLETAFGLNRDDYVEVHEMLCWLAAQDSACAPLSTLVFGQRSIGEGPTYPMCLFRANEVFAISTALDRVGDDLLNEAIKEVLAKQQIGPSEKDLHQRFTAIKTEMAVVANNGWALIAFMF